MLDLYNYNYILCIILQPIYTYIYIYIYEIYTIYIYKRNVACYKKKYILVAKYHSLAINSYTYLRV